MRLLFKPICVVGSKVVVVIVPDDQMSLIKMANISICHLCPSPTCIDSMQFVLKTWSAPYNSRRKLCQCCICKGSIETPSLFFKLVLSSSSSFRMGSR
jgi:hypothetical protein